MRRVGFKPLQSSVGSGKDGPGVRPTAPGSFYFSLVSFLLGGAMHLVRAPLISVEASRLTL
jgi:hypothetical protein